MPADSSCETIILHSHDIGDADRLCILLTKERGKIAARARGVRKLRSRMGGSLLPFQQSIVTIHDGRAGFLITGAQLIRDHGSAMCLDAFLKAEYIAEILLKTLEDDHPVPEMFALTSDFLGTCRQQRTSVLPFLLRFLLYLGVLPGHADHRLFMHLTLDERATIDRCIERPWKEYPILDNGRTQNLHALCERLLDHHTSRPRRVTLAQPL